MASLSNAPPRFSLGKVFKTIATKGPLAALDDPEEGPHVHLVLLLITILAVSGVIILATSLLM